MEAPLPVAMLSTINRWFPSVEKGTAVGIFLAAAKFGPVLVPPLGALIITSFGWQYVYYICAAPGVLLATAWYVLVANDPARSRFTVGVRGPAYHVGNSPSLLRFRSERKKGQGRCGGPMEVVSLARPNYPRRRNRSDLDHGRDIQESPNVWGLAIAYLLMTGIINVILAWLPTYLTTVKQLSIMNVGFIASAPFIGGVLGNLLGGVFSDRVVGKRRKPTIIITALSSVFMMYALIHAPNQPLALIVLLFFTGLLLNLGYSSFTVYPAGLTTKETYPSRCRS